MPHKLHWHGTSRNNSCELIGGWYVHAEDKIKSTYAATDWGILIQLLIRDFFKLHILVSPRSQSALHNCRITTQKFIISWNRNTWLTHWAAVNWNRAHWKLDPCEGQLRFGSSCPKLANRWHCLCNSYTA